MRVLLGLAVAFVVGSGLAALPSAENEPCLDAAVVEGTLTTTDLLLWPVGTRCVLSLPDGTTRTVAQAASVPATLGAIALCGALLAAGRRRVPGARGAVLAAAVLGLLGLLWQLSGEFSLAFVVTAVVGSAATRRPIATVVVLAAWVVPAFAGAQTLGIAAGLTAGALAGNRS